MSLPELVDNDQNKKAIKPRGEVAKRIHAVKMKAPSAIEGDDGEVQTVIRYVDNNTDKAITIPCTKEVFALVNGNIEAGGTTAGLDMDRTSEFTIGVGEDGVAYWIDVHRLKSIPSPGVSTDEDEPLKDTIKIKVMSEMGGFDVFQIPRGMRYRETSDLIKRIEKQSKIEAPMELGKEYTIEEVRTPLIVIRRNNTRRRA